MALTREQTTLLTIHLVRDLDTIRAANHILQDELFTTHTETLDAVFWFVARDNYRRTSQLTPREHFEVEVRRRLAKEYAFFNISELELQKAFIELFSFNAAALSFPLISPILEEFITARTLAPTVKKILDGDVNYVEIAKQMSDVTRRITIGSAQAEDLSALGTDVFLGLERVKTGCIPFDALVGGIRLGETIGLLGPMKGGKTSLCQSISCDYISQPHNPRVTYVTYEESRQQQWPKFLICFMNKWPRTRVEGRSMADMEDALKNDLMNANRRLVSGLNLIDMSGTKTGQGYGGIPELVACLESEHRTGRLGDLVIVDHLLPMLQSFMGATGMDADRQTRHLVMEAVNEFKNVMVRLGVAGILAHQMDATGNNKKSHHKPTHMDSAECKHFGMVLHECICLGIPDEKRTAYLNLSASRSQMPRFIHVKIAGDRCRVLLSDKTFEEDKVAGGFISTDELEQGRRATSEITGQTFGSGSSGSSDDADDSAIQGANGGGV